MASTQSSTQVYDDVPIAPLPTIDFSRLERKDSREVESLLSACRTHGFFYLNLKGVGTVLNDWQEVLRVMETYFSQDLGTKMKDDRRSDTYGYEPCGTSAGAVRGKSDFYETLKIARSEMLDKSSSLPQAAKDNLELFERFIRASDTITKTLLARLSDIFNLVPGSRFEDMHRLGKESRTTLVLFRYPQQTLADADTSVGHNKHTDIGTLTLLFSEQWGLQVLSPEDSKWNFVAPKPDHAVINVGDSLRFLSGHVLNSCVHRVIPKTVTQRQEEHRYSIAYFLRPEDAAQYKDVKGRMINARAWHDEKYEVFRQDHDTSARDSILTGGMEMNEQLVAA